MKAALLRISGEGESEKWWKRLLGCSSTFPETVGVGVSASPGVLRVTMGSSSRTCLCDSIEAMVRRCWNGIGGLAAFWRLDFEVVDFHLRLGTCL